MVGEVGFAEGVQAGHGGHEVVVDPQPTHRVVRGGIDAHRDLRGVLVGDPLVHVEQVPVALVDGVLAEPVDGVGEVEVHAVLQRADAMTLVHDDLGGTRRDVARREVAEGGVQAFEVVVAVLFGDLVGGAGLVEVLGHPDAAVVAQRLRHEGQLRLERIGCRDAGRVDLRVAGVGEQRALLVGPPRRRGVAVHGVRRQVERIAVAAGAQQRGVTRPALDVTGGEVAGHDAGAHAVLGHHVEQLGLGVHLDGTERDLLHQCLIGAEEQLLPGLAPRVEGAAHLGATERTVVEQSAVLTSEGHTLGHALVDDVDAHLGEAVHVRLAGAEVAALHRVVEEAVDAVAVVLVVLGAVDPALGGDRVGAPGGVVEGEALHLVAELGQRGRGGRAGEAGADHEYGELALVGRVHELHVEAVVVPAILDVASRDLRVEADGGGAHVASLTRRRR